MKRDCQERTEFDDCGSEDYPSVLHVINKYSREKREEGGNSSRIASPRHGGGGIVLVELNEKYEPSAPIFVRVIHFLENLVQRYCWIWCTLPVALTSLY